jgi:uncharacterized protein (DUF1697 family)
MTKYVAFLRGINVGGRIIKMTDLRTCFEQLGFQSVVTVLQTGNVVFEASTDLAGFKTVIEDKLSTTFPFPIYVQIFTFEKVKTIIANNPFTADDTHHSYVLFFENNLERQLVNEASGLNREVDLIKVGDGVIYWNVPIGLTLKSGFAKYLTKASYKNFNTNRNVKTLQKILSY